MLPQILFVQCFAVFQIGTQGRGDGDASVGMLKVFKQGDEESSGGEAGAIEGMHPFGLAGLAFEADVSTSSLIITKITAGRYFPETSLPGEPHFEIVGLAGGESHVADTQHDDAVMQSQFLQNLY